MGSLRRTRLVVWPTEAGLRLDRFVAGATGVSRRRVREWIGEGRVWRNGRALRIASREVEAGDAVEVLAPAGEAPPLERPPAPEAAVVYEDRWLLAADKPAGVLSQPAEGGEAEELAMDQRLLLALAAREGRRPFLRLVHRLDRVTSGLLLLARNPEALPPLAAAWREGRVGRLYLAVVEGEPDFAERRVEAAIARVPGGAWKFCVDAGGKPAATEVEVRSRGEGRSVVACRLLTGRTHQVRVHLAHLGHPVLGDRLYGSRTTAAARPLLHAAELTLPHPATGAPLRIQAPAPEEMAAFLR